MTILGSKFGLPVEMIPDPANNAICAWQPIAFEQGPSLYHKERPTRS